jgi:hypothetical protein
MATTLWELVWAASSKARENPLTVELDSVSNRYIVRRWRLCPICNIYIPVAMIAAIARAAQNRPEPRRWRLWKVLHDRQGLPVVGVGGGMSVW